MSEITKSMTEQESRKNRFRILVNIDGSEESYQSLRYAAKNSAFSRANPLGRIWCGTERQTT